MMYLRRHFRFIFLVLLTGAATVLTVPLIQKSSNRQAEKLDQSVADPQSSPPALVAVQEIRPERIELQETYSGMIRSWERYSLSFEVAGRVAELGVDSEGQPNDDGSQVRRGTVLARLDDRLLRARNSEAEAKLKQADAHYRRAQELKERGLGAITETEVTDRWANKLLAEANLQITAKNLEDATLVSPVDGYIAQRRVNVGESVAPQQIAFELVQTDRVLLVLGIPETRIPEIEAQRRRAPDGNMKVYVELVGRDRFGKPWPIRQGSVYQISETADDKTGLFEVEIELSNHDEFFKPGMVARGRLVTAEVYGYRVPSYSALFKNDQAFLYTIVPREDTSGALTFPLSEQETYRARRIKLDRWLQQGPELIVPEPPSGATAAIVRGQHRLVDGQLVRITGQEMAEPEVAVDVSSPSVEIGARPN